MRANAVLLVLGLAGVAGAEPARSEPARSEPAGFAREFQAGVDAFRLGKLDRARGHLEKARELAPKLAGPHRFLAAVAHAQGRWPDCIAAARRALALNPRSTERQGTRKLHDRCRQGAGLPPHRGDLGERAAIAVTTSVPGAAVKIGGLGYGSTPVGPRPIEPGTLAIELAKRGFRPAAVEVDALPGIVTDVSVELIAEPPPPPPSPAPPPQGARARRVRHP
ncbi:MAG TPA: PEGA domain-containing protein [Kofleriaceae bacterium]|nr:PEGA domain-containing protein [Kofleriaceae bacterium]